MIYTQEEISEILDAMLDSLTYKQLRQLSAWLEDEALADEQLAERVEEEIDRRES